MGMVMVSGGLHRLVGSVKVQGDCDKLSAASLDYYMSRNTLELESKSGPSQSSGETRAVRQQYNPILI